jgi:serine/threonine protein kinase
VIVAPGQVVLHYRLVEKIGEGGMGVVWKAVDTTLDREVAVKILPDSLAADPERLQRFEREAKVLASLNHPTSRPCTASTNPAACVSSSWSSSPARRSKNG